MSRWYLEIEGQYALVMDSDAGVFTKTQAVEYASHMLNVPISKIREIDEATYLREYGDDGK